jgi:hypothetical protein
MRQIYQGLGLSATFDFHNRSATVDSAIYNFAFASFEGSRLFVHFHLIV